MATIHGAQAFNLNIGKVEEGVLADLILIDLNRPELTPNHNLHANLVYSANASCINTVICDGKILMGNRKVEGEDEIIKNARKVAYNLVRSS